MKAIDLNGQVAVVTGSGRGLGLAFAHALARAGARVVVNDIDADTAQAAAQAIVAEGGEAVCEVAAVGSTDAAERLVARAVDTWGRLDVMCANAGILRDKVLWNMSDEDFDAVIHTHLRGTFTCARAAVRQMRAQGQGGRLVLVASPAGQRGNFGQGNYAAAKAGIAAMARTWAMECAKSAITVNAMVPVAWTQMVASIPALAPVAEALARGEPLPADVRQRLGMGTPEDVAPLLVFLASRQAVDVTGQCIGIGGDKLALWSHPQEAAVAYREGGWTAEAIAAHWRGAVGLHPQSIGMPPF
ncbi:SDR family NAD(P)-dependent oxidoreductase [Ramlibacter rhizophilus]|uniref:SDR family oxidoreductase n=1 Tax=Ramlibacter rhizophilus TaxID=1781167 RepID=A0A4Z0BGK8_9BURK|nr:SDR family NAD(P)-dependent oxidoreductase [Ramlibacter rhizophilus]TFY97407.1 SDR family oxidoreductase [Ramlibacter rhizophilus]